MRRMLAGGVMVILVMALMAPSPATATSVANNDWEQVQNLYLDRGVANDFSGEPGETIAILENNNLDAANHAALKVTQRNPPLQTDRAAHSNRGKALHLLEPGS